MRNCGYDIETVLNCVTWATNSDWHITSYFLPGMSKVTNRECYPVYRGIRKCLRRSFPIAKRMKSLKTLWNGSRWRNSSYRHSSTA
ncbi:hypothetical protein DD238_005953 [Peronospora effusa]|uniref:Uncharacterized protein n=1 Tax=Peronospora effusa TaxID=542832 RepID=A0A3M6VSB8_9STRA|nr:hypothetical protein DD238_005953 [Peronospora effusa]RQM17939.1 hypothetical protein DD237_002640 [Peronospora effusa]